MNCNWGYFSSQEKIAYFLTQEAVHLIYFKFLRVQMLNLTHVLLFLPVKTERQTSNLHVTWKKCLDLTCLPSLSLLDSESEFPTPSSSFYHHHTWLKEWSYNPHFYVTLMQFWFSLTVWLADFMSHVETFCFSTCALFTVGSNASLSVCVSVYLGLLETRCVLNSESIQLSLFQCGMGKGLIVVWEKETISFWTYISVHCPGRQGVHKQCPLYPTS